MPPVAGLPRDWAGAAAAAGPEAPPREEEQPLLERAVRAIESWREPETETIWCGCAWTDGVWRRRFA